MMKTMSIVFQTEDGDTVELSYKDAKEMYVLLHQIFADKTVPTYMPPYTSPYLYGTPCDVSKPFFS